MKIENLDLTVSIAGITLKNPVTTASGTFSAKESSNFYNPDEIGGIITKGVTSVPWKGNPTPRIAETYGGMINSIGLENPGVDFFIKEELPYIKQFHTALIVNVAGRTVEEYCEVVEKLNDTEIDMMEINISCPNIKKGGISFGTDPKMAADLTKSIRRISRKPFLMKLTPNVGDITEIARAVESEGADGISLINTLLGMRIDVQKKTPVLSSKMGGLSGPAVKPVAVRMVYQVRQAVGLPILGLGGIMTGEDAVEFIMAGADAVSVGMAALVDPMAPVRIKSELIAYMVENGMKNIREIKDAFQDR